MKEVLKTPNCDNVRDSALDKSNSAVRGDIREAWSPLRLLNRKTILPLPGSCERRTGKRLGIR